MSSSVSQPALPLPTEGLSSIGSHAPSQRRAWCASLAVLVAIPAFVVAMRLFLRFPAFRSLQASEWFIVIAWLLQAALCIIGLLLLNYGVGYHGWNISLQQYWTFGRLSSIQQIIWAPAICLIKIAYIAQILPYFVSGAKAHRGRILNILAIFNCLFFCAVLFITIFQCSPREMLWNNAIQGHCMDHMKTWIAIDAINLAEDIIFFVLPLIWVRGMQFSTAEATGVSALFILGLFALISSSLRLAYTIIGNNSLDITISTIPITLWSISELTALLLLTALIDLFTRPTLPGKHHKDSSFASSISTTTIPRPFRRTESPNRDSARTDSLSEFLPTLQSGDVHMAKIRGEASRIPKQPDPDLDRDVENGVWPPPAIAKTRATPARQEILMTTSVTRETERIGKGRRLS